MTTESGKWGFGLVEMILVGVVIIVVGFLGWFGWNKYNANKNSSNGSTTSIYLVSSKKVMFVTASPFDISQIGSVSKFRSCAGHDYSGLDIDGQPETNRSMKNYAVPLQAFNGTVDKVKVLAPFDATILNNSPGKQGDNLDLVPVKAPGYIYELGHISSFKTITKGSRVTAGELIGYYQVDNSGSAFDMQLWFGGADQTINTTSGEFDSLFAHLAPNLASSLAAHGLTADNLIVSKAARDASTCVATSQSMGVNVYAGDPTLDFVTVKQ